MILCVCVLILHEKGDHSVWLFFRNILHWFYLILIFYFPDILEGNGLREAFNALATVNRDRGYFWSLCGDYVTCFTICGIAEKIFLALMSASLGVPKYHSNFRTVLCTMLYSWSTTTQNENGRFLLSSDVRWMSVIAVNFNIINVRSPYSSHFCTACVMLLAFHKVC